MKPIRRWFDLLFREWLLAASLAGLVVTSLSLKRWPRFSPSEMQVLFLLGVGLYGMRVSWF